MAEENTAEKLLETRRRGRHGRRFASFVVDRARGGEKWQLGSIVCSAPWRCLEDRLRSRVGEDEPEYLCVVWLVCVVKEAQS